MKPMKSGEIIDLGARIYQSYARPLLKYSFAPMLLCFLGLVQVGVFVLPGIFVTKAGTNFAGQFGEVAISMLISVLVSLPLFIIGVGHSTGLATRVVSDVILGNDVNVPKSVIAARVGGWAMAKILFKAVVVSCGVLALGLLFMLVGGILSQAGTTNDALVVICGLLSFGGIGVGLVAIPVGLAMFALIPVVAVLEPQSDKAVLSRSRDLMRRQPVHGTGADAIGNLGLLCIFVGGVIYSGASIIVSLIEALPYLSSLGMSGAGGSLAKGILDSTPAFLTLWFLVPFWTCGITLVYFDRRVRLEALDIEMLARDVLHADRTTVLL